MAQTTLKKNSKHTSSVAGKKAVNEEMVQPDTFYTFSLSAIALLVAICVAPLTALSCKLRSQLLKNEVVHWAVMPS